VVDRSEVELCRLDLVVNLDLLAAVDHEAQRARLNVRRAVNLHRLPVPRRHHAAAFIGRLRASMGDDLVVELASNPHSLVEATSSPLIACGRSSAKRVNAYLRRARADYSLVQARARLLKELIEASVYVVDERALADAIVARAMTRLTVAEPSFRNEQPRAEVRSFRRDRRARSFHLTRTSSPWRTHRRSLASLDERVGNRSRDIPRM
jgi:hypothetical protein